MDLNISMNFLTQLRDNNNRDWFKENKAFYTDAKEAFEQFIDMVIPMIKGIDSEIDVTHAKACTFRIFRDVRFSKSKLPYKTNFGAFMAKGGRKSPFAGYYIHLEPSASFVGGGVYMPESKFLRAIRIRIYEHTTDYKKILNGSRFKKYFSEISGEKLKSAPRGFSRDFEDVDLLKNKHYAVVHNVDDSFWTSNNLFKELTHIFKVQFLFNQFLNKAIRKAAAQ